MTSFEDPQKSHSRITRLLTFLVAVLAATVMWYWVCVSDRLEAQLDVNLDYYGIPQDLVITDGLISKMVVRLRGPEILMRALPREHLTQSINLSSIKPGINVVPLGAEKLGPELRAFELVDIQPPSLNLLADTIVEKSVPLRTVVDSPLKGGALTVENVSVSPATVVVRGPEEAIAKISNIPLIIKLDPKASGTTRTKTIPLDTPSFVSAIPPSVQVHYTITSGRTVLSRTCVIRVAGDDGHHYEINPHEINLMVEVPEAMAKNKAYLDQLEVSVAPPPLEINDTKRVKLRFRLPEGMTLLSPISEEVAISRVHK